MERSQRRYEAAHSLGEQVLDFFTLGFWLWAIKVSIPLISVYLISFAISPKLTVIIGYGDYDGVMLQRDQLLTSSQRYERIYSKIFFAMIDNRLIVGWIGGAGLVLSLIYATS